MLSVRLVESLTEVKMRNLSLMRIMVKAMYTILLIAAAMVGVMGLLVLGTSIKVHKRTCPHVLRNMASFSQEVRERLTNKTIFFGHKSVGYNIIDGIRDIAANHESLNLRIVETKDADLMKESMLAHAQIGRNLDPESKIAEFKKVMEAGLAEKVDIAFFKFCYVDIGINSDPNTIIAAYCEAIDVLKSRLPQITFVHVTVPLCGPPKTVKGMIKSCIKQLIGRPPVLKENKVRARYNTLLRKRFSGKEPLFDLALYETIGPGGMQHYSFWKEQEVPVLVRSYTDDGGHLNTAGRQHIAEQLLISLLDLVGTSQ